MRPLRLLLDGFGSYRDRTEVDLSDVDFFVLTGPTGSGKSTVIDALCFALYGTVPRWGKGNVIRNALAPSTAECRVCLVFEAAGGRYAAARHLRRDARGQVHTKEARLDRLDPGVPPDADLQKILESPVEQVAEGPDDVSSAVGELLGITYEHFTQCVLLPQGRFAEFLHAKASDRQDLLIELLAYAVYGDVGQRARERGRLAATQLAQAERRLAEVGEVTPAQIEAAAGRVADLAGLVGRVDAAIAELDGLRAEWTEANEAATLARQQVAELTELRMPAGAAELAAGLAAAAELIEARTARRQECEAAESAAVTESAGLVERAVLLGWREEHARADRLAAELAEGRARGEKADAAELSSAAALAEAQRAVADAEAARVAADRAHGAATLAAGLAVGEPCPVCRQPVGVVPHHEVPADVAEAGRAEAAAKKAVADAGRRATKAAAAAAEARAAVAAVQRQVAEAGAKLAAAPDDLDAAIERRAAADAAVEAATAAVRAARRAADEAARERESLRQAEKDAWSRVHASRDGFVALGAPAVDGVDLGVAWRTLLDWAAGQRDRLTERVAELGAAETSLRRKGSEAAAELTALLAEHGVDVGAAPARAPIELAAVRARADHELADLRSRRETSVALAAEVGRHREDREVAELLGKLMQSNQFERWLCTEALDSLVLEASQTLLQLSGGQFELHRGERNDLVVLDHNDAGTQRPVNTLSGGETFQASLALALALSRQVVGLSGGRRDLNSMFLDEGFGTLDETTLDTVAATLERLAEETDRMVGIVTHVAALAERVPVQFAVRREGASSRIRRVAV